MKHILTIEVIIDDDLDVITSEETLKEIGRFMVASRLKGMEASLTKVQLNVKT